MVAIHSDIHVPRPFSSTEYQNETVILVLFVFSLFVFSEENWLYWSLVGIWSPCSVPCCGGYRSLSENQHKTWQPFSSKKIHSKRIYKNHVVGSIWTFVFIKLLFQEKKKKGKSNKGKSNNQKKCEENNPKATLSFRFFQIEK